MTKERDRIAAKIRAMQARTVGRGCTEAEAYEAAKMIAKLLTEYDLSLSDVEIGEERCEKSEIKTGRAKQPHEIVFCVSSIASFADCKAWKDRKDGVRFVFFGLPKDVEFATFLYHTIRAAMDFELSNFKFDCKLQNRPTGRRESHSFLLGMGDRIKGRLREMKDAQNAETKTTTGRDLVVVKSNVVAQQFAELGMRLSRGSSTRSSTGSTGSYEAGRAAGDKVGFNRAVTGGTKLITGS